MTILMTIPILFTTLMSAFANAASGAESLDLKNIHTIVVTGDASTIRITTKSEQPYRAVTSARRSGWLSSWYSNWFFDACKDESRTEVEGATLTIRVAISAWSDIADCSPEVAVNMPPGSAVRIEQEAFLARLNGNFASLHTSGKAADITPEGHASAVGIAGAAVRANLTYGSVRQDETIDIAAQSLDASLGFGREVAVDYTVTAKASYIDSLSPSVPGARPLVNIKGDYVHARIR